MVLKRKRARSRLGASAPRRSTVAAYVRRLAPADRAVRLAQVKAALKTARTFYKGFAAADGYNLNKVKGLSKSQADALLARATYIKSLQARAYKEVRPRSAESKATLNAHIAQGHFKNQKVFLYHTHAPEKTVVRIRGRKLVELRKYFDRMGVEHTSIYRNYFFKMKHGRTFEDLMAIAAKMAPHLPPGQYRLVSSLHSDIGVPVDRDAIVERLLDWFNDYGKIPGKESFAETIIGLRWIGSDFKQSDHAFSTNELLRQRQREIMKKKRAKESYDLKKLNAQRKRLKRKTES
jgi:hypothetical protein